jgi:LemA protein
MAWVVPLCIVVGIALVGLLWYVVVYNRFVSLRNHLKESWADVDVELKRRYDLIPNLVRTVKGYAAHEKDVFESITQARAAAVANTGDPSHQSADEQRLVGQLGRLFVVAEAYPELKADRNFLDLQEELSNTPKTASLDRRSLIAKVVSGVVPQQPPTTEAPASTHAIPYSAKRSGSTASVLTQAPCSSA